MVSIVGALSLLVIWVPTAILAWHRDSLPERVAIHWGPDGNPDGWASPQFAIAFAPLFTTGIVALLLGLGAAMHSLGIMAPVALGMAALLAIVTQGSLLLQLSGSSDVGVGPLLFVGVVALVLIVVLGAWALRGRITPPPATHSGTFDPVEATGDEPARYDGRVRRSKGLQVGAGVLAVAGIGLGVLLGWGDSWAGAAMALLVVVCALAMLAAQQRVVVDDDGLTTYLGPLRVHHFAADDILAAGHVHVEALGEFGGLGWRHSIDGRRSGLVTGSGEALIVQLRDGKDFVITVDDAPAAARVAARVSRRR